MCRRPGGVALADRMMPSQGKATVIKDAGASLARKHPDFPSLDIRKVIG